MPANDKLMNNYQQTIISEYAVSPTLNAVIGAFNQWIDPAAEIDDFYDLIWNLDTAVGYGLDVWGRIVGVGRVLQVAASKYFGFDEATNLSADPFNQSPFYSGQTLNNNFILSDDGFRTLILAKALSNICDGSIPAINQVLINLFGSARGNVYVTNGLNMTMTYTFTFTPTPVEVAIVSQSGVLPLPAGVSVTVAQI
jgi:hypothetical protein